MQLTPEYMVEDNDGEHLRYELREDPNAMGLSLVDGKYLYAIWVMWQIKTLTPLPKNWIIL